MKIKKNLKQFNSLQFERLKKIKYSNKSYSYGRNSKFPLKVGVSARQHNICRSQSTKSLLQSQTKLSYSISPQSTSRIILKNRLSKHNAISVEDRRSIRSVFQDLKASNKSVNSLTNNINETKASIKNDKKEIPQIQKVKSLINEKNFQVKNGLPPLSGFCTKKNGNKYKTISSSLVLIKTKNPKDNLLKRIMLGRQINKSLNNAIKLKILKWLWIYKAILLEKFIICYKDYKFFFDKTKITQEVIEEFMQILGMERDKIFIENIFLLFDHDRNGSINFQEFLINSVLVSDSSQDQKLNYILNFLTNKNSQLLYFNDFKKILHFVFNKKEIKYILENLNANSSLTNIDKNFTIDANALLINLKENKKILRLFQSKMINYNDIDDNIENELGLVYSEHLKNAQNMFYSHATKVYNEKNFVNFEKILQELKKSNKIRKNVQCLLKEEEEK